MSSAMPMVDVEEPDVNLSPGGNRRHGHLYVPDEEGQTLLSHRGNIVCRVRDPLTVSARGSGYGVVGVSAQCGDGRGRRLGAGPVVVRGLSCRPGLAG